MSVFRVRMRYLIVAALCTATHIAIMSVADAAEVGLAPALIVSFCCVVVLGYMLHTRFSFATAPVAGGLLRYTGAMAMAFPVAAACLWFYLEILGLPMWLAAAAGSLTMLVVNYLSSRWAIVRKTRL